MSDTFPNPEAFVPPQGTGQRPAAGCPPADSARAAPLAAAEHATGQPVISAPEPAAEKPLTDLDGAVGSLPRLPGAQEAELPRLQQPARGRRLAKKSDPPPCPLTPEQRLLVLDAWQRSGLPAGDFAPLV